MSEHEHEHHRNYVKIWGILVVLLIISVLGPLVGIKLVTLFTAFGIAVIKAYMVAKNFMHLDVEKPIVWYILGTCVVFMALFFAGVSPDVMHHDGTNWQNTSVQKPELAGFVNDANASEHEEGAHE